MTHEDEEHARLREIEAAKAEQDRRALAGEEAHVVHWSGTYRGTDEDPRETGWCDWCGREVYDGDGQGHVNADAILTASEAEVDAELRLMGIDPERLSERGQAFAKLAVENARLRAFVALVGEFVDADAWALGEERITEALARVRT